MSGRGRASTLPAWMTAEHAQSIAPQQPVPVREPERHSAPPAQMSTQEMYRMSADPAREMRPVKVEEPPRRIEEVPRRVEAERSRGRDEPRRRSRSPRRDEAVRKRSRSRSKDRGERPIRKSRSRSRDRDKKSSRSSGSDDAAYSKWKAIRENRRKQFDQAPPAGSDGMPAAGFPISCMATLPMNLGLANNPLVAMGLGGGAALTSNLQQTKNARRLYVGGIPPGADEQEVARFFNDVITKATGGTEGLSPVLSVYINHEKFFAFVELNSVELTTACGQLDGIEYKGKSGSVAVRVRRPNDFRPELLPAPTRPIPILDLSGITGSAATSIPDGPNKIYIGNVPVNLGEEQVRELLEAFGALKAFHLLRDPATRLSKGYGYCEYVDPAATPIAVEGLHNLPIGDKILIAHLSSTLNTGDTAVAVTANIEPTKVILLTSLVTKEELVDVNEYEDIVDDVRHECSQYGTVTALVIPRTLDGYPQESEGSVYVEFLSKDMAKTAAAALSGRKFADRTVVVDYYDEALFSKRIFI